MNRDNLNELMDSFEENHANTRKSFLRAMFTPMDKVDNSIAQDLERRPGELHIVPQSFREKLDNLSEPIPESTIQEMYIYHEKLRKKGLPKGVIRNAIKREFGIIEYDS